MDLPNLKMKFYLCGKGFTWFRAQKVKVYRMIRDCLLLNLFLITVSLLSKSTYFS